jgi:hypothetical protein
MYVVCRGGEEMEMEMESESNTHQIMKKEQCKNAILLLLSVIILFYFSSTILPSSLCAVKRKAWK